MRIKLQNSPWAVFIILCNKLSFRVPDVSSVGTADTIQFQDGLLRLQKASFRLPIAFISHRTYLMGSGSNTGRSFEIVGFVLRMLNGCCKACGTETQLWRVYSPRLTAQTCLEFASSVVWVLGCSKLNPPLSTFCPTPHPKSTGKEALHSCPVSLVNFL